MADTVRSLSALQSLLADNSSGDISAQDVRDMLVSQDPSGWNSRKRTAAEISAGKTPSDYSYAPGNIKRYGAVGDASNDDTTAIQDAIDVVSELTNGGLVWIPAGTYKVVSELLIGASRVNIRGEGDVVSMLVFAPSANGSCLRLQMPTENIIVGNYLADFSFYSNDSTYTKTALELVDVSDCTVSNIGIAGSVSNKWSGGSAISPDTTDGSIGIRTRGRDSTFIGKVTSFADRPLVISKNPNTDAIAIDHFHFQDLYLGANAAPNVEIDDGVELSQVTFDGYQAWVFGTHGLYWHDTTTAAVSEGLVLANVRTEQGTGESSEFGFDISLNTSLNGLAFRNCYTGDNADRQGVKLRNVDNVVFDQHFHIGSSNVTLDVDSTIRGMEFRNCFWQAGSTASVTGQHVVRSAPHFPGNAPLPPDAFYQQGTSTLIDEIHDGVISSTTVTVANDGTVAIGAVNTTATVFISNGQGISAIYMLNGPDHTVFEVSDPAGHYSNTATTASSTNIYWSAGNSKYELENKRGSELDYKIVSIGSWTTPA